MNKTIDSKDVINTVNYFLVYNKDDEATENVIIALGAELLGVSEDKMLELLEIGE